MAGLLSSFTAGSKGNSHRLPVYEHPYTPTKERLSDDSYDESDSNDSDVSSPDAPGSRYASTTSLQAPILAKPTRPGSRRPVRPYRLPNRLIRYVCFGLVGLIVLFIASLVRASHNENIAIAEGKITKKPPPPPIWESYPFLTRYYGGIKTLVPLAKNAPEYPRAKDELPFDHLDSNSDVVAAETVKRDLPSSKDFTQYPQSVFAASPENVQPCFLDKEKEVQVPPIRYYEGRPSGFPENVLGSYELLGLPEDVCFERYGKYAPYGLGYSIRSGGLGTGGTGDTEGIESTWSKVPKVIWKSMNWADTQRRCYQENAARYDPLPVRQPAPHGFYIDEVNNTVSTMSLTTRDSAIDELLQYTSSSNEAGSSGIGTGQPSTSKSSTETVSKALPRTAVVVRCWDEYIWREEDIMNLRSLITELSLASGGRYDVHLLVQVKNEAAHPIWADSNVYKNRINETLPPEFQGIATLWTETQMLAMYQGIHDLFARGPDLPVHGVYRGLQMAMQHFAYLHPEYDYFWQWEMDIRYTGHYYDLFSKVEQWTKEQPRKGLWERNARFYLPSVHGDWEDFKQMARVQSEMGTTGADNVWENIPGSEKLAQSRADQTVWGPERPNDPKDWFEPEKDPKVPWSYEKDKYVWGVGEEADYITFNPMFDPAGTTWGLADDITGYNETEGNGKPPRRAHIITASRMSRRLLLTMHKETAFFKHHAFPEMWPGTVALQHGFKAVFTPHPLYVDREWPTEIFASTLNAGKNGASGGSRNAVFGDREHNLEGLSWFYRSGFAPNLYRRWLGLTVNNDGGEEFELIADESKNGSTVGEMRGGEGRMCLPPMLLHPIKDVELPVEEAVSEIEIPESDPNA
ncbi:hypothetical protein GGR57DRAFT_213087 [Xylariaceae sp. FL1272]|nr:hypothetical protein GGR57DRAFT_213087 [Xylariaceae sp. FL1272]